MRDELDAEGVAADDFAYQFGLSVADHDLPLTISFTLRTGCGLLAVSRPPRRVNVSEWITRPIERPAADAAGRR